MGKKKVKEETAVAEELEIDFDDDTADMDFDEDDDQGIINLDDENEDLIDEEEDLDPCDGNYLATDKACKECMKRDEKRAEACEAATPVPEPVKKKKVKAKKEKVKEVVVIEEDKIDAVDEYDLSTMTSKELLKVAKEVGVNNVKKFKKAELIKEIEGLRKLEKLSVVEAKPEKKVKKAKKEKVIEDDGDEPLFDLTTTDGDVVEAKPKAKKKGKAKKEKKKSKGPDRPKIEDTMPKTGPVADAIKLLLKAGEKGIAREVFSKKVKTNAALSLFLTFERHIYYRLVLTNMTIILVRKRRGRAGGVGHGRLISIKIEDKWNEWVSVRACLRDLKARELWPNRSASGSAIPNIIKEFGEENVKILS